MKIYEPPDMEVIRFSVEDIIAASDPTSNPEGDLENMSPIG